MAEVITGSFSLLNDFTNCAYKAYRKYVSRDLPKEEPSEHQTYGNAIHGAFEHYVNGGALIELPEKWARIVSPMVDAGGKAEVMLGMMEDCRPAGFYTRPTWFRGKVDVLIKRDGKAILFDWKTGKVREDPRELACHAMLVKANFPEVEKITGAYVWLKENKLGTVYELSPDRAYFGTKATMNEIAECEATGVWEKKPNPLCGWCPVKDCEHNRS